MKNKSLQKGITIIEITISLGILMVAAAIAYYLLHMLPQQNSPKTTQTSPVVHNLIQQLQQPPPQATKVFALISKNVGEPFIVDGVQYSIQSATNLGNDLSKVPNHMGWGKSNGGTFILVTFTAKNTTTAEVSLNNTTIFLTDSAKDIFSLTGSLLSGSNYTLEGYTELDQESFQPTSIKPAFTVKIYVLSEVSKDSSGLSIAIANQKDQNFIIPLGL